jgi:hypothetical protein
MDQQTEKVIFRVNFASRFFPSLQFIKEGKGLASGRVSTDSYNNFSDHVTELSMLDGQYHRWFDVAQHHTSSDRAPIVEKAIQAMQQKLHDKIVTQGDRDLEDSAKINIKTLMRRDELNKYVHRMLEEKHILKPWDATGKFEEGIEIPK